ncbi:MAG: TIGR01777 family protein [Calditrichaeota bacterium]|nr:MAG: TIGR01777 family protein [Calditrichota bacterium]MBL1207090.1 TIGR01777 family protein [Calditrichota bacterium]NOG46920.1 TIGR01777 family protein [Calditrichota bacterium]
MQSVLVTGATGLVGKHLCSKLQKKGYDVKILSRQKKARSEYKAFYWNPVENAIDKTALEKTDYIIHLAGANLSSKRWSKKRKKQIVDSRAGTTKLLFESVSRLDKKPMAFISSSAVGFYGTETKDKIFVESDPAADDFLGTVCREWEEAAGLFSKAGIRTVKLRTSLVLSNEGPLSKILLPIKMGLGSPLGSGLQFMPWIHIEDLCNIFVMALEDSNLSGAFNAAAPEHVTNEEFTKILAKVLNRPLWLPKVPSFVLKAVLGQMSMIALQGSRVSSEKISKAGYKFKYPTLKSALENICKV